MFAFEQILELETIAKYKKSDDPHEWAVFP